MLAVSCFPFAIRLITRLTTYSLFGEPLCRDSAFLHLCCKFGDALPRDALILRPPPSWTRTCIAKVLDAPRTLNRLQKVIRAEIERRGDTREKNPIKDVMDFIMDWVDHHPEAVYDAGHIADMMITTIFAALHTTSQLTRVLYLVVHTLFELATRQDYVVALREEIKQCFEQHGQGTKLALDSMCRMDSFIKETQRCNPLDASSLARLARKEFTFSNGLHIPAKSFIFTPNSPIYQDERHYPNPTTFDGFRFARMRSDPELKSSCDLTATGEYSMHFGFGRHTCPGRFMVADEAKLTLVHLLQNFDFCVENFGPRPKNSLLANSCSPT
ncbi:hypothetical protein E4U41_000305 [Claviceps citrina]|nr:hypothetical protein E4U41_000305 [Claviceps citrina]